jgi:hypothetical protein
MVAEPTQTVIRSVEVSEVRAQSEQHAELMNHACNGQARLDNESERQGVQNTSLKAAQKLRKLNTLKCDRCRSDKQKVF